MSPERGVGASLLVRAVLAGAAVAAFGFASAALLLSPGVDTAGAPLTALLLTLVCALAVGLWAGAPGRDGTVGAPRAAWFGAGIAAGVAGAYATAWSVSPVVQASGIGRILALVLVAGAPVYALGLLLPSLLAEAEGREEQARADAGEADDAATADGWAPLGTVVVGALAGVALGSVLVGLVLLPRLGAGPVLLGTAALLIAPTLLPEPKAPARPLERVLYRGESAFSTLAVVEVVYPEQRQPELRFFVNGEEQSGELARSGAPTLAYVVAAEQWLTHAVPRGARFLFLGGGAYTLPRRVAERDPGAEITVVELDPEVTRLAGRFFGLRPQHRIASLHGDARAWVERLARERAGEAGGFDAIYLDVYDGRETLPYALVTREAAELYRRLLRPGGWLAVNVIGTTHGPETRRFWSTVRTVADVFPTVALYPHLGVDFPGRQNVLLVASAEANAAPAPRAGRFELWPREAWPRVEGSVVFRDALGGAPPARRSGEAAASGGAPSAAASSGPAASSSELA